MCNGTYPVNFVHACTVLFMTYTHVAEKLSGIKFGSSFAKNLAFGSSSKQMVGQIIGKIFPVQIF